MSVRPKTRVLLVHAAELSRLGGAEISLAEHLDHAPENVDVDVVLPDCPVSLERYHVVVLANLRPIARQESGSRQVVKSWLWERLNRSPLQRFALRSEVAWADLWYQRLKGYRGYVIRSERDVHPCVERSARCLDVTTMERSACDRSRLLARAFERLYNACDAVQFLSPLHRRAINQLVEIDVTQYEVAPPLDLRRFHDYTPTAERTNAALLLADEIRCAPTAESRARDAGFEVERVPYLSVPYEQMPALLNRYRAVVMDPVMLHAFGRLAAEALACGCRLIASERVGALSWPDPLQACRESNQRFWEMVTNRPERPNARRLNGNGRPGAVAQW